MSSRANTDPYPMFFIHVMRTAGTSLRRMLEQKLDASRIYPSEKRINELGRYPELVEVLADRQEATAADLMVGHYPFALRSIWDTPPFTLTILRDPVERTVSILKFARLRRPQFDRHTPLSVVFEDDELREAMIRNYQTKVFALPSVDATRGVNHPAPEGLIDLETAKERLSSCDVVGVTERFAEFVAWFEHSTGLRLPADVHTNESRSDDAVAPDLRERIAEVTELDAELVRHAHLLLDQSAPGR